MRETGQVAEAGTQPPSEFTVHLLDDDVRRTRLAAWFAAVLMLAASLAGCTMTAPTVSLPPVPAAGPGLGTIVWLADPTAETATNDVRQVLADAFEQAYPSITVKLETGPTSTDALRAQLVSQLPSGSTPDVYDGDVIWPSSFAPAGYAVPLSKYLPPAFWDTFGTAGGANSGASFVRDLTYNHDIYGVLSTSTRDSCITARTCSPKPTSRRRVRGKSWNMTRWCSGAGACRISSSGRGTTTRD